MSVPIDMPLGPITTVEPLGTVTVTTPLPRGIVVPPTIMLVPVALGPLPVLDTVELPEAEDVAEPGVEGA